MILQTPVNPVIMRKLMELLIGRQKGSRENPVSINPVNVPPPIIPPSPVERYDSIVRKMTLPTMAEIMRTPFAQDTIFGGLGITPEVGAMNDPSAYGMVDASNPNKIHFDASVSERPSFLNESLLAHESIHVIDLLNQDKEFKNFSKKLIDRHYPTAVQLQDKGVLHKLRAKNPEEYLAYTMEEALNTLRLFKETPEANEELKELEFDYPGITEAYNWWKRRLKK